MGVHNYMLITILMFIFPNFWHSCFCKFSPIIWISSNWLKFHRGVHFYMLITVLMFIFLKFFSFIFLGKFDPKIWSSSNWLKFGIEVDWYMLMSILMVFFFRISVIHTFWANLVPKSEFLQINWNLIQGYIATCLSWF